MKAQFDQDWHDACGPGTAASAKAILAFVQTILEPKSLVEIGCGHGHWLAAARELGILDVLGVDGPWTEMDRLLIPKELFRSADLGQKLDLGRTFDLVLSAEVAEHIHSRQADQFVDNICRAGQVVLFGAAIPLQGGFKHINEQWPSYWIPKFKVRGYRPFDLIRPAFWSDQSIHYYYRQNLLIFVHQAATSVIAKLVTLQTELAQEKEPLDLVHPEKFAVTASYEAIALKRLLPKLPRAVLEVLRRKVLGR